MRTHPGIGSFTFIGVGLTEPALAPGLPFEAPRWGSGRGCLAACPTAAFVGPRLLDARRCISYLTIEHRAAFSDGERELVGDWLFGCDECQDVCPWNVKFAAATRDPELAERPQLAAPDLAAVLAGTPETFDRRVGDTPFEPPGAAC